MSDVSETESTQTDSTEETTQGAIQIEMLDNSEAVETSEITTVQAEEQESVTEPTDSVSYTHLEPFPFTSKNDNDKHRENIINKAGIFLFVFGDLDEALDGIQNSGIWREYILAKKNKENILIPLPCGIDSISYRIFEEEKKEEDSFSAKYSTLLQSFDYKAAYSDFYDTLVDKIILTVREKMDNILDDIELSLK